VIATNIMDCNSDDKCGNCGLPHKEHHQHNKATCGHFREWCGSAECPRMNGPWFAKAEAELNAGHDENGDVP
jgi:hypothetical protein